MAVTVSSLAHIYDFSTNSAALCVRSGSLAPSVLRVSRAEPRSARGASGVQDDALLAPTTEPDTRWDLWPALPVAPYGRRKTIREEYIAGELWGLEQVQGLLYVHVPIRMLVYRLRDGGLLLYGSVAPTGECMRLLRELEAQHGKVKYLVLPTVAVEHKVYVGPLSKQLPSAQVWVAPGQFSVPFNLPLQLLGFPQDTQVLSEGAELPWGDELRLAVLGPVGKNLETGAFCEAVLLVPRLETLLVTDLVVTVNPTPPQILLEDKRPLLYHARDGPLEPVEGSSEALQRGWEKIVVFSFFFQSSAIEIQPIGEAFADGWRSEAKALGWGGVMPWTYRPGWRKSWEAVTGGLLVPPILQELVLPRTKTTVDQVQSFADKVASWSFRRIAGLHFQAISDAGPREWRAAFASFLDEPIVPPLCGPLIPLQEDYGGLREFARNLEIFGVIDPKEKRRKVFGLF